MPSDPGLRRYLAQLCLTAGLVLATLVAFNLVMDPYYVWRWVWPGVNRDKPWVRSPETVALEAALHRPRTVIIGPSHVAIGFDPRSPAFRAWDRPYVVSGVGPDFGFEDQFLDAMSAGGHLRQALVELDPRQFEPCNGGTAPVPSVLDGLKHVLLLRALGPSTGVLWRNLHGLRASDLYVRTGDGPVRRRFRASAKELSNVAAVTNQYLESPPACATPDASLGHRRLDRLVGLARARHFALTFFIGPYRPEMLIQIERAGHWGWHEALRRRLATYATRTGVTIWDFSTTELARADGAAEFTDYVHFVPAVGDRMLSRMHAGASAPRDPGSVLNEATVTQALAEQRRTVNAALARPASPNATP